MITIPVQAADYLPYIMRAAERGGYLGLMVVLARTAEARSLHQELTRDWTSIHDVTGHALAVLCPEPHLEPERRATSVEEARMHQPEAVRRHEFLKRAALHDIPPFDYTRLVTPGIQRTPIPRHPPQLQHAAWTEAVSRCAGFFGVPEQRLPALLVVCLREDTDVLIQLREDTSVYELCKRIASHPGYLPGDYGLLAERDEIKTALDMWGVPAVRKQTPPELHRMRHLAELPAVRKQTKGLHQHLDTVAHVAPGLRREVAEGLQRHIESDAPADEVQAWLSGMAHRAFTHPRKTELLRLHAKLRKVAHALEKARPHESDIWDFGRDRLAEMKRRLAARPGLAAACEDAAREVLGDCETGPLVDTEEYRWLYRQHDTRRIRTVWPVGRPPRPSPEEEGGTRNTLCATTVHGAAVQAGTIDALHLHIHGDGGNATSPRPERGWRAWLRRARGRGGE
ncbi:hypothetical protein [Streptomonospora arabica]|uniref:Uncharacterized protein n=1 Tax=Streptomonospora arabica TaxID=412417 RepID=A0ABV9STA3_9ACTN